MAKRKKLTPLQKEYKKQIDRLERAVKRAEQRGWIIPENALPQKPKRITKKSVERLKKIKPLDIYKKSKKLDIETGELVPPERALKEERHARAKKAAQTRKEKRYNRTEIDYTPSYSAFPSAEGIIISNFKAELTRFPAVAQPLVNKWLNMLLRDYDKSDVAEMLENAASQGLGIDYSIAYREDLIMDRLAEIMDLLPGASEGHKKDLIDALEYEEEWEQPD